MMEPQARGNWKTRTGFLFAVIGSAVGLGNIWRFPYLAYKNGGGAFLVPYLVAMVSVGVPLMILEFALGHKFRASAPIALSRIGRKWEFFGWWAVAYVYIGILFYYCVVLAWCLNYLKFAFGLEWGSETALFFEKTYLGLTKGPYIFGGLNPSIIISLAVIWIINGFIVYRGIRRGIEIANKILVPVLFVLMIALVVWSVNLHGAGVGIKAYLWPDFSRLADPGIWSDAFGQIFLSLSVGMGIIIAYASYLPARSNLKTNAFITCLADSGFSIFAGFAVFSTLGYMSYATGKPLGEVVRSGPGLAFITYPATINLLPFGNKIFGVLFFVALLFAGISSSISVLESAVSSMIDKFGWARHKVTFVMSIIGFLGGLIFITGSGLYWLDIVDHFIMNLSILTVCLFEAVIIGWVYKAVNLRNHINEVSLGARPLGRWWEYVIAIWIPLVLGILIVLEFIKRVTVPYSGYSWLFVVPVGFGWIVMNLAIAWFFKSRRWRQPPVKEAL